MTSSNNQVLLLDGRERAFSAAMPPDGIKTRLAQLANTFPELTAEHIELLQHGELTLETNGGLGPVSRKFLFGMALDILRRESEVLVSAGAINSRRGCDIAFIHSALRFGSRTIKRDKTSRVLRECITNPEETSRQSATQGTNMVSIELIKEAIKFIQKEFPGKIEEQQRSRLQKWIQVHDISHRKYAEAWKAIQVFDQKAVEAQAAEALRRGSGVTGSKNSDKKRDEHIKSDWFDLYDILTSPASFSASIHDLTKCDRILGSIVRIDRLPTSNSLQALLAIKDAWYV